MKHPLYSTTLLILRILFYSIAGFFVGGFSAAIILIDEEIYEAGKEHNS